MWCVIKVKLIITKTGIPSLWNLDVIRFGFSIECTISKENNLETVFFSLKG